MSAGVLPTPAIAYLTRTAGYDAGIVISASHNPFEDNGIKVFSGRGEKVTERVEREVEAIVADSSWRASGGQADAVARADLVGAYLDHLRAVFPEALTLMGKAGRFGPAGFKLGIDCANGATTPVAPELLAGLGFETVVIANHPDGRNINLRSGSTHPEALTRTVVERGLQMGVAFDGDGDRAIFVDHRGAVVNGDAVLLMCADQLQREGRLKGGAIVQRREQYRPRARPASRGIELSAARSVIKHVMEEMLARVCRSAENSRVHHLLDYLSRRRPVHRAQRSDGRRS